MSRLGGFGVPGIGALSTSVDRELLWGGDHSQGQALWVGANISSTAADAGNTPTTDLRPGLILGEITATGELAQFNGDASDGTEFVCGILDYEQRMIDFDGTAADREFRALIKGNVRATQLLIEGTAFTSHLNEHNARRQMVDMGFIFDDDRKGHAAGKRRHVRKIDDYTVLEDDNGTVFNVDTADANFTLPTIRPGLYYEFQQTADFELAVTSSAANMIVGNNATATSVTFTTAGEQIAAHCSVESFYQAGTTLKWKFVNLKTVFSTDDFYAYTVA
jgi:hypothetical protein